MQNVKLIDCQWVTKSVVEKWYAKFVNKLLPNCINLHVQIHRWHLLELALAQEIEVLKTADFYHYLGIHMSGFKGNNFLRIYKRYEPSFWSKKKDYSGFIRTRQYTVFTTDYYSNRGLFISVHSVWYIYYIRLFYTAIWDSHFLLTREFSLLVPIKKLSLFPNLWQKCQLFGKYENRQAGIPRQNDPF